MERFISVDSGKFATKRCWTDDLKTCNQTQFRTKLTDNWSFEDDAVEKNTYICEIDGKVMKVGNSAINTANLETSKKSIDHRFCTLLAIALQCSAESVDNVHVAIGIPLSEYGVISKRIDYRDYIVPKGEVKVKYKDMGTKEGIIEKTFNIVTSWVYPETNGAQYLNMTRNKDMAAVIDIGSLNVNGIITNNFEPDPATAFTSELGGQIMINNLSLALSAEFGRVDSSLVSRTLRLPLEERGLKASVPNPALETASKELISKQLISHVKQIRRNCDAKGWPIDFMPITFIGGTSALLREEIKDVFGETTFIPAKPEYANCIGFLRRMVAWETDSLIDVNTDAESA